ncbi:SAM-dependent methyltransferase, partial [Escherichia coli]|nr:SAM-dependent methyltransferase [Escherichia coli]
MLEAAGGKWNRKEQAHIFTADAAERIEQIILTGSVDIPRDLFNFFPTPENLVTDMVLRAEPAAGERVLEPEFGDGRILKALKLAAPDALITGIELNDERFLAVKN